MLATLAPSLRDSGMTDDLPADAVPEPQAGRDLEGQRVLDRLRTAMFGVETGPTRIGRYQILKKLGKGAMGTVYAADDPELNRRVAIKVLHAMDPDTEEVRRCRLQREAQAMACVQHPHVVQVFDVCADAAQPFIVMELIDGETLRAWQARPGHRWEEVVQAYLEVARGLAALHRADITHRDFKPDNALRDMNGRVRVVDFGLVSAAPSDGRGKGRSPGDLTREGALVGTLMYMSPEQLSGARGDAHIDQFSLCCSLFEAVYRVRPFVGNDPEVRLTEIHEGVERPRNPLGAPRRLFTVLRRGLAELPARRFPDMSALADALEHCLKPPRWRTACLVLGPFAAAVVFWFRSPGTSPCENLNLELADLWDLHQETAIHDAFVSQGIPDAPEQWRDLNATMHEVRARWPKLRDETCRARQQARPPAWALQRDRCLDDLRSLIKNIAHTYLSPTPTDIAGAPEAAASLDQRLRECARIDPQHLQAPPPDVAPRLTTALEQVAIEQFAGRLRRAEDAARRALEIADQSGILAATAEARHSLGRVLGHQRRPAPALTALDTAAREAARAGHDRIYIDARLFAAKVRILDLGALDSAARDADDADDFITRLDMQGIDTASQTAESHEVRGFLAEKRKDLEGALEHFGHALRLHRQLGDPVSTRLHAPCRQAGHAIEISDADGIAALRTLHNLARVLGDLGAPGDRACADTLYRHTLALSEKKLGPLGPLPLDIRYNLALRLRDAGRDAEALAALGTDTLASRVQYGERSLVLAEALLLFATLALDAQDLQTSGRWARESAELFAEACVEGEGCPPNYGVLLNLQGEHARISHDFAGAAGFYRAAIEALTPIPEAQEQRADNMVYLAEALAELGNTSEARTWLLQATEQFQRQGREADPGLLALQERLSQ